MTHEQKHTKIEPPALDILDHEDERIWAWLIYCLQHIQRGEFYSVLSSYHDIRHTLERWSALLQDEPFNVRRLESRWPEKIVGDLSATFTSASRETLKQLLIHTIDLHSRNQTQIQRSFGISWTTSDDAITHVCHLIESA